MSAALVVLRKELIDVLRDRRTLLLGFVLPALLAPALSVMVPGLAQERLDRPAPVAVIGAEHGGDLVYGAELDRVLRVVAAPDADRALRRGEARAVLVIPADFRERLARGRAEVVVRYNAADQNSLVAKQKVLQAVAKFSLTVVEERLRRRGLPRETLAPIDIREEPVRGAGGGLALTLMLPWLLAVWALTGASHVASDLGAGEKERGTLEALLSAPAPRGALVAGKFAATATLAFASTLVAGASQTVVLAVAPAAWFEGAAPPAMAPATAAALAACAAGVAAMSASWLLALSLFARSMREANQYSLPLLVLVMVGGVAAPTLEDTVAAPLLAVVPFVNAVSAMRGALIGRLDPPVLALTLAACGVYALGGVRLAIGLLRRESAILRV